MKDTKELIEKLIDVQIGYCNDRKEIRKYLEDQPVVLAMLESYTERIDRITEIIVEDILEIPEEPANNKYQKKNWTRSFSTGLIEHAAENNGEYKESVLEILMDWKNMSSYIKKVETSTWFYREELLKEHSEGFPTYQKKLEEEEKEKKKRTKKTTA
ncbi:hypothetical protein ACLZHR_25745 [Priestia aryabhattai]|uniref:hypothetical protein n=1 Tax=Priestia aryabhattai TaxID=412384 RepID=UPI003A8005C8